MPPKWIDAINIKFVELFKEKLCLWDQYHDLYKIKNAREKALSDIVGLNVSETPILKWILIIDDNGVDVCEVDNDSDGDGDDYRDVSNGVEDRFTVHQEVQRLATQGSVRRIDIIAIKNNSAYILDPTIRFETHADQPHEVDSEKKRIYEPTIPFYKDKYSLSHIDVIGLMVGARGTIPSFFANKCKNLGLTHSIVKEIAINAFKGSVPHTRGGRKCDQVITGRNEEEMAGVNLHIEMNSVQEESRRLCRLLFDDKASEDRQERRREF
ncbi:hypothetical protein ANN_09287 [Periplaneta americana]|uniref:Uncharacterized protein n=1 Tax=Periplaneta americana TaxID=6978 RepID=A0ABQ8TKY5_PERAM|nr:hypothetical protein ANN_09287 [Periplaneta americana]